MTDDGAGADRLVIRAPNHLGELILALPALRHAASVEARAGRQMWVQVAAWLTPILELADLDADILALDDRRAVRQAARQVSGTGAKRGILLTPSASSAIIFRLAGLRERRGTAGGMRTWLLTDPVPREPLLEGHRVHEFLALVGGNTAGDPPAPRLQPPDDGSGPGRAVGDKVVGLFPGANGVSRRWPAGRFSALAGRLAAGGTRVLVLGGPGEEGLTEVVAAAGSAAGECEDLGGRSSIREHRHGPRGVRRAGDERHGPDAPRGSSGHRGGSPGGTGGRAPDPALGPRVRLVGRFDLPCVPCVRNRCPRKGPGTELTEAYNECMWLIEVDEVERVVEELLDWGTR